MRESSTSNALLNPGSPIARATAGRGLKGRTSPPLGFKLSGMSWRNELKLADLLGGCIQSSVFARPEIVYSSGKTIGVRYVSVGVQSRNETEAMELLAKHCGGAGYQVTNRTVSGQPTRVTIDAVCL